MIAERVGYAEALAIVGLYDRAGADISEDVLEDGI